MAMIDPDGHAGLLPEATESLARLNAILDGLVVSSGRQGRAGRSFSATRVVVRDVG